MSNFLLELFSEEIPARMQESALNQLASALSKALSETNISYQTIDSFVTPRRMAVHVTGLPDQQPDVIIEKKGPTVGAPNIAIQGFLRSIGKTLDDCEQRAIPKGSFWFYAATENGRPTHDVLSEILPKILDDMSWPKSMRWGETHFRWVRPLHSILSVFSGEIVPFTWNGISAGRTTYGHRVMGRGRALEATNFHDYKSALYNAGVVLDHTERRQIIWDESIRLADEQGLVLIEDKNLLDEVTGLVEWPVPLLGQIDTKFMDVPEEVLITSIRTNQKYFLLRDQAGELAPNFIVVANIEPEDKGMTNIAGNERVLRARLSDAKFFWDNDNTKSLESFLPGLETVVFHQKLGFLSEKVQRIETLAGKLAEYIEGCASTTAMRAARLAKADLTTEMVFEFPEVQGVMGSYYAMKDGESADVCEAIAQHYSPLGPSDHCPSAPISVAVALADKLDTIVGFWLIGEKPTGRKDPFALRRAGLGIIRLIIENDLRLPMSQMLRHALSRYDTLQGDLSPEVITDLMGFLAERLNIHLKQSGIRHDLVAAVFALKNEDDFVRLIARVNALQAFIDTDDGANILAAYRRAVNILRIEEKKDKQNYSGDVDVAILSTDAEKLLFASLKRVSDLAASALCKENDQQAMAAFAALRVPIDSFFNDVIVNADDPTVRMNRLKLLSSIRHMLHRVADFSVIEG